MITFLVCLALLVGAYFIYGAYLERQLGVDPKAPMPCHTRPDGVDYVPLPKWKIFLIQLLNIAGLGPIFGAVLGATYGPIALLWITAGGILIGGVHDFVSGYISVKMDGLSYPEIVGRYLGVGFKQVARVFTALLMILVGAVFLVGPAGILEGLTNISTTWWVWIIFLYYFLATILPVDKIIGRAYPIFGAALLFMAVALLISLLFSGADLPELDFKNYKINAEDFPIIPTLFITIACGAVSGFHATQSPMMARCMQSESHARPVFFGAMISESIIALIWATVSMLFFGGVEMLNAELAANGNNAAVIVDRIANGMLGKVGGVLVLLGVVVAPISTGDTAFRSARLIIADFLNINQSQFKRRIAICLPLFALGYGVTLIDFDVLWRYFAWVNQLLSVITLWVGVIFFASRQKYSLCVILPAIFMSFITIDYLFISKQFFGYSQPLGHSLAAVTTIAVVWGFMRRTRAVMLENRRK